MHDATSSRWTTLDITIWSVRAFYLLSSLVIIVIRFTPALASRFLPYGARAQETHNGSEKRPVKENEAVVGNNILDRLAEITVPKSWFLHFYVLSNIVSVIMIFSRHKWLSLLGVKMAEGHTLDRAQFCCYLMMLHGARRAQESWPADILSKSRMWVGHYALGLAFYVVTNFAIWIDGIEATLIQPQVKSIDPAELFQWFQFVGSIIVFLIAQYKQGRYHRYLDELKKYTLPVQAEFAWIVAPHYTAECAIYISLAFIGAPRLAQGGRVPSVNWSLLCAALFAAVNLGVTADGTKKWQLRKFGDRANEISRRWKMIPFIF
jgi:3-oxo-5-alpha-steroid 4-dehydrogenase 3 / polyprenol reductase